MSWLLCLCFRWCLQKLVFLTNGPWLMGFCFKQRLFYILPLHQSITVWHLFFISWPNLFLSFLGSLVDPSGMNSKWGISLARAFCHMPAVSWALGCHCVCEAKDPKQPRLHPALELAQPDWRWRATHKGWTTLAFNPRSPEHQYYQIKHHQRSTAQRQLCP